MKSAFLEVWLSQDFHTPNENKYNNALNASQSVHPRKVTPTTIQLF